MAYKVLDILKDLPGTNCKDCGKTGCFAFATGVYLDGDKLSLCPHLSPEKLKDMEEKLAAGRAEGGGKKESSHVQALNFLMGKIAEGDFKEMAAKSGATYDPGPPEGLHVKFVGRDHLVTAKDVKALDGGAPSVWVKVFLYIYVTRATGADLTGKWVSFRELPNTVSKEKTYERKVSEIVKHMKGGLAEINRAALALGGEPIEFGSAHGAWRFDALPRVPVILLYWPAEEEFEARATLVLDGGILDYLDQEAIVFLAEAFVKLMTGGDVADVIP